MRMRGNDATTSKFMAGICVGIHRLRGTGRTTRTDRGQVMNNNKCRVCHAPLHPESLMTLHAKCVVIRER